MKYSSQMTPNT